MTQVLAWLYPKSVITPAATLSSVKLPHAACGSMSSGHCIEFVMMMPLSTEKLSDGSPSMAHCRICNRAYTFVHVPAMPRMC